MQDTLSSWIATQKKVMAGAGYQDKVKADVQEKNKQTLATREAELAAVELALQNMAI